ncbi:hypothetical protein F53441_2795 [Fusarium austroafricanum]|uniref:Uncharacterized protein n=1 Tax=Fusarium austroafricanum TaxID=2364996 RepID=A0A8H4KP35_9HYPO|nr:hypothetical protein F53441_2795 [Fusarium austroafricanum]
MALLPHGRLLQQPYKPACTHLTMTRMYDANLICSSCHEPGQFGWLYQCTQDHERIMELHLLIWQKLRKGSFAEDKSFRKRSVEAQRDKLSFLEELTPKQMASYRPDQIATILRQREKLKDVIAREELRELRRSESALLGNIFQTTGFEESVNDNRRWAWGGEKFCEYKICQRCRPICVDRAFLSLNAVADGEIAPTAAAGFGFEPLGGKPVIDKDVVRCIDEHRPRPQIGNRQMIEMLDEQIARMLVSQNQDQHLQNGLRGAVFAHRAGRKLPTVENIAAAKQRVRQDQAAIDVAQSNEIVIPATPDLLGSPWPWLTAFQTGLPEAHEDYQLQRQHLRQRARVTRIPRSTRRRLTDQLLSSTPTIFPSGGYSWRLFGDAGNPQSTSTSPLNDTHNTDSRATENENGVGESTPLGVGHGVAMTEESIEARVPDVVTQV